ncbi:MAG: toll/interleukin-1 receptor domain-containing protein [Brevefilum sp.]|nr:toll/interleukin-1 receptor domain-containing protein [Brevefilum sp.]
MAHDVFVSYSHNDKAITDAVVDGVENNHIRCWVAPRDISPGSSLGEAIDDCRKVAAFYSPTYLDSKVCIEEFNIALCRHRESDEPILKPIYLYSANLPTYMRLVQFFDCRESNPERIEQAVIHLLEDAV